MSRRSVDHVMVASLCRANPGQWQEVGEYGSGESADAMVRAIRGAFQRSSRPSVYAPAGAFEARRELTDSGARVHARFVGEPIMDVEAAVAQLGALPVPAGDVVDASALVIYRAEWDVAPLGWYTTEAEARKHCEDHARRDLPGATFDWIVDEEDGVAELAASFGEDERSTGYVVTSLEIASKYDPEADE